MQHRFVEFIPNKIEDNIIYISLEYCTAAHKCMCGCGNEVVTPISPRDWSILFDGDVITLDPSIGNWSFSCRSHYWIKKGKIIWASDWNNSMIENNRRKDRISKSTHYNNSTLNEGGIKISDKKIYLPDNKKWWHIFKFW